ncbi:MAG: 4Fe-4S dicluster domain-containing protein [Coriobacteriia bacterium]
MADIDTKDTEAAAEGMSRRQFVAGLGGMGAGTVLGGFLVKGFLFPAEAIAFPGSEGYIIVDTLKCGSCQTCMAACSLAHEGTVSPSTSRIQIIHDRLHSSDGPYQVQCRQCPYPACVEACPTGACTIDESAGNVRWIDQRKCIGCERCIEACPFTPARIQFDADKGKSQKCDLCKHADYWDAAKGPACVAACPMNAIAFTTETPSQIGNQGYSVNLRNEWWGKWWPYDRYTTWPASQTVDPSTWQTLPETYKSVY